MTSNNHKNSESVYTALLCHFSFWFGLLFATPIFVALHNPGDLLLSFPVFVAWAALACLLASLGSWKLCSKGSRAVRWWISRAFLAAAIILAIQGNVVHELFEYGDFNGQKVNFRRYGWRFWLEWMGWLTAFPFTIWLLSRIPRLPAWLAVLPAFSFLVLLAPSIMSPPEEALLEVPEEELGNSVFSFSRISNLIHLLPDGLQGDVVRQVLQENPELAKKFQGFTLFTDHVGRYPGTAPSLYTMLMGQPFDLESGWKPAGIFGDIKARSYPNTLARAGYQIDYVPASPFICIESANSCLARPFNDLKARGFIRHQGEDVSYSIRLIADLSLFRLAPMFLKEHIYNDGHWLFADTTLDGSSPWPDPVIREWADNMHIVEDAPVYKWHHYIGTHVPPKWDENCRIQRDLPEQANRYAAQAHCILNGIGTLLDRMREKDIYDQTAFVISGDHGHNSLPNDMISEPLNWGMFTPILGTGRPALLVKKQHDREPLQFSSLPTDLQQIAPTALALVGLGEQETSVFQVPEHLDHERVFHHYSISDFWTGDEVPYIEFRIGQPSNDSSLWAVSDIQTRDMAPAAYDPVNRENARGYVMGARLRKSFGNTRHSWIRGRQLAFAIGIPQALAGQKLELELQIMRWMPEQSFTLQLNNGAIWRSPILAELEEEWQTISAPLELEDLKPGNNFISLVFAQSYPIPGSENERAAALIRSIRVSHPD